MNNMTDQSPKEPDPTVQERRGYTEAAERARRLQVWLDGVLAGVPSPADAQNDGRVGDAMHARSAENFAEDTDDLPAERPEPIEVLLLKCRRRIRDRRELTGVSLLELAKGERERRSAQIIETFLIDCAAGSEPTPLHLILAARYIELEIYVEKYSSAVRVV